METRIEQYSRSTAPRYVDFYTQLVILCSGFMSIFGWSFFGFGMIFIWVFGMASTITNPSIGRNYETTEGKVLRIEPTNYLEDNRPIYQIYYTYASEGNTYEGSSYSLENNYQAGDKLTIQYNINRPMKSKIEGLRSQPFSAWVFLVVAIFPMIGLIFIAIATYRNGKALRLLKNGAFTTGKVAKKEATNANITINNRRYPIYRYTFNFYAEGQPYTATCKTHKTEVVEDEVEEIILYQPGYPAYNTVYDANENMPHIDEYGSVQPVSPKKAWVLIIPGLSVLIHGLILLFFYW